uniref:Uncharacterized protein n=1 Tax=Siphoviridae sp. ctt0Q14 TaxID=2826489 RepID=A0A8S5QWQ6_9CAUD|nr:MAG TPA: hypothetical protein [Siphoviridae sp. ctt0Q14]DAJ33960.1 MAG TPA: hypothetical protein [Caudoviricetes sp.]DAL01196.1 MAG TPA: hypothetical protein [Caudoviricetes sp.]DAM42817.1 MAG TPA: hypothetical protein [Caudoviricetes sp.]DAN26813.1 MAG TPA: hypothetical protein [Caudoviricetes sp.]
MNFLGTYAKLVIQMMSRESFRSQYLKQTLKPKNSYIIEF